MKTNLVLFLIASAVISCGCTRPPQPVLLTVAQEREQSILERQQFADMTIQVGHFQLGFSNGTPVRLDTITGRVAVYVGDLTTGRGAWLELAPRTSAVAPAPVRDRSD